jgi:hypothetical protein
MTVNHERRLNSILTLILDGNRRFSGSEDDES